jgi:hypothetical protein
MMCIRIGLFLVFAIGAFAGPLRPAPTFTRDVALILYRHCVLCHRATELQIATELKQRFPWLGTPDGDNVYYPSSGRM